MKIEEILAARNEYVSSIVHADERMTIVVSKQKPKSRNAFKVHVIKDGSIIATLPPRSTNPEMTLVEGIKYPFQGRYYFFWNKRAQFKNVYAYDLRDEKQMNAFLKMPGGCEENYCAACSDEAGENALFLSMWDDFHTIHYMGPSDEQPKALAKGLIDTMACKVRWKSFPTKIEVFSRYSEQWIEETIDITALHEDVEEGD